MKLMGKDKKSGKRIVMLTDFEWDILTTALFEYHDVSCQSDSNPRNRAKLTTVMNRIYKAENDFNKLIDVGEKKSIGNIKK